MEPKFKAPDDAALKRMSVMSISALLDTLRAQRKAKTKNIDEEISYYEKLLSNKRAEGASA